MVVLNQSFWNCAATEGLHSVTVQLCGSLSFKLCVWCWWTAEGAVGLQVIPLFPSEGCDAHASADLLGGCVLIGQSVKDALCLLQIKTQTLRWQSTSPAGHRLWKTLNEVLQPRPGLLWLHFTVATYRKEQLLHVTNPKEESDSILQNATLTPAERPADQYYIIPTLQKV